MEDITPQKNELVKIITESGLGKGKGQELMDNFLNFFELADDWNTKADALVITNISQKAEMKMAGEGRKFLKSKRVELEKTRVKLKADSKREGETIDSIAKILKNLIEPIEEKLEEKEKFAERLEEKRKNELKAKREFELIGLDAEFQFVDLANMPEENYKHFLENAKLAQAQRIEEERKAIEDKKEYERLEKLRWERAGKIKPYYTFFDESIKLNELSEEEFNSLLNELMCKKSDFDIEQDRVKLENERLKRQAEENEKVQALRTKIGTARQGSLVEIGIHLDFATCADMEDSVWDEFIEKKNNEYHNEQNRLYIEKLKSEREAKEQSEKDESIKIQKQKRSEELRPYIVFIRDYNGLIEKDELEYQKELKETKEGAELQWTHDREESNRKIEEYNKKEYELEKSRQNNLRLDKYLREKIAKEQKEKEELEARAELELSKGDAEKLSSLLNDIKLLKTKYTFKSKTYQTIQRNINELLEKTITWANTKK